MGHLDEIRIDKANLLAILKKNRDGHRKVLEKGLADYKAVVVKELEKRIKEVLAGKQIDQYLRLIQPEDHTNDYDRVIKSLTMSLDDDVQLTQDEFAQYVDDDWGWKKQFTETTAFYSANAPRVRKKR